MMPRALLFVAVIGTVAASSKAVAQAEIPPTPKYLSGITDLEKFIIAEMAAKEVPGLAVAVVDGEQVVWSKGFGFADPQRAKPITAETVFAVGRVSECFISLLMLSEARAGKIELDARVSKYLPSFKPKNSFETPVTVRHLLAHCSGLVREAPVGNRFSAAGSTLKDLVESLNATSLTHRPGRASDDSTAATTVAALLLETVTKQSFDELAAARICVPLGMRATSFRLTDKLKSQAATGNGWTQYGRTFPRPLINHTTPEIYATVRDMSRFVQALYNVENDRPVSAADLKSAFAWQFSRIDSEIKYGLGFTLGELDGSKRIGSAGSTHGCTTEFALLPGERVGVIVCVNKESAGGLTRRVVDGVLRLALAVHAGKPTPTFQSSTPLKAGLAKTIAGRFEAGGKTVEVLAGGDRAWLSRSDSGVSIELRSFGSDVVGDDALSFGPKVVVTDDGLQIDGVRYSRTKPTSPTVVSKEWRDLIGEYGTDVDVAFVLEKDDRLHLLIDWFYLYPLTPEGPDRFRLPNYGRYSNEPVIFQRSPSGRGEAVSVGGASFKRRTLDGEDGATFRIKPLRPVADIRKETLTAKPPVETGDFHKPDLVDLATLDPTIKLEIRYASDNNFLGTPLYTSARAFMQRPAAEALLGVHKKMANLGYGVQVYDAYRPWNVTKLFWEATPESQRIFVADPSKGSRHNRGCAVDMTLYSLKTGKPIDMVSGYDEFSDRAYPEYPGGTSLQRANRALLRTAMEAAGFTVYEAEWWHYDYKDWRRYPILNRRFEELH